MSFYQAATARSEPSTTPQENIRDRAKAATSHNKRLVSVIRLELGFVLMPQIRINDSDFTKNSSLHTR